MFDIGWQEKLFHLTHIQFPRKIAQSWFVKCHLTTVHSHQYEILNKYDINGKFTDDIPGPVLGLRTLLARQFAPRSWNFEFSVIFNQSSLFLADLRKFAKNRVARNAGPVTIEILLLQMNNNLNSRRFRIYFIRAEKTEIHCKRDSA